MNLLFSDYDLSLVCTSRCDDDYIQCVSACSDTDCLLDCNRAAVACADGMVTFIISSLLNNLTKLVPVIRIVLKVAMVVKTQFAFAM